MANKFQAVWSSASSIGDFLSCPRAYYLKNIFKDSDGQKMAIVSPALSLGSVIHETLEPLLELHSEERKNKKLAPAFFSNWAQFSGERGGFDSEQQEKEFQERGIEMIKRAKANIHHLEGEAAFLMPKRSDLPWMWLSEEDELILCGKTDVILKKESYEVIDFKTGMNEEREGSLQLPIYKILLSHFLKTDKLRAFYWYLQKDDNLKEKELPPLEEAKEKILNIVRQMKVARAEKKFECPHGGCRSCQDFEKILRSEAKFVGHNAFRAKTFKIL